MQYSIILEARLFIPNKWITLDVDDVIIVAPIIIRANCRKVEEFNVVMEVHPEELSGFCCWEFPCWGILQSLFRNHEDTFLVCRQEKWKGVCLG